MDLSPDPTGTAEGQAMLERLPGLYFAILKTVNLEQQAESSVCCSVDLPAFGRRAASASTAQDAIRSLLVDLCDLLTKTPTNEWPSGWHELASSASSAQIGFLGKSLGVPRFKSKSRQATVGVTMPLKLKRSLQRAAELEDSSFAEIARQFTSSGFEAFEERSSFESPRTLLLALSTELGEWDTSQTEQVMLRLDSHLSIRLRSSAKEYWLSASAFGAMCLVHGHLLHAKLEELKCKIDAVRGSQLRRLIPKLGLVDQAVSLIAGILAGSILAPKGIVKRLSEALACQRFVLDAFLKRAAEERAIPAFKAERGKPLVASVATSWAEAVKSLNLPAKATEDLLRLDD